VTVVLQDCNVICISMYFHVRYRNLDLILKFDVLCMNMMDHFGNTPAHLAASKYHRTALKVLMVGSTFSSCDCHISVTFYSNDHPIPAA
jgi:hypothetical protein